MTVMYKVKTNTKIYAYGVVNSNKILASVIKGLEGAKAENAPYRDIGIVVSKFNGDIKHNFSGNVLKHEYVVEELMNRYTVLPMKFGTVFSEKIDLQKAMREYYGDFKKNLARLLNRVEFDIKVLWQGDELKKEIASSSEKQEDMLIRGDTEAKKYLKEKFKSFSVDKKFKEKAGKYIKEIDGFFCGLSAEKKLYELETENLLLNAFYLIDKAKLTEFREAFRRFKKNHVEFKCLFSGPWPPYNFIELNKRDAVDKLI